LENISRGANEKHYFWKLLNVLKVFTQNHYLIKYWTLKNIWVFIKFANHHLLLNHNSPSLQMGKCFVKNVVSWVGISYYSISLLQSHG
jgi:hypothetical protein